MMGTYNREIFAGMVRTNPFGGTFSQSQWEGMEANLDYIDRLSWHPVSAETQYFNFWNAYAFATDFHETARTMQPIEEYGGETYLRSKRYYPYYGRGKVQLTWEENYRRSDREIAAGDLISAETLASLPNGVVNQHGEPSQALVMEIACCNLFVGSWRGWYTGRKLWDYLRNDRKDYVNARRIINGTDRASTIAGYAEAFEAALLASWQERPVDVPPPDLPPHMPPPGAELPPEDGEIPASLAELFRSSGADEIHVQENQPPVLVYRRRANGGLIEPPS